MNSRATWRISFSGKAAIVSTSIKRAADKTRVDLECLPGAKAGLQVVNFSGKGCGDLHISKFSSHTGFQFGTGVADGKNVAPRVPARKTHSGVLCVLYCVTLGLLHQVQSGGVQRAFLRRENHASVVFYRLALVLPSSEIDMELQDKLLSDHVLQTVVRTLLRRFGLKVRISSRVHKNASVTIPRP